MRHLAPALLAAVALTACGKAPATAVVKAPANATAAARSAYARVMAPKDVPAALVKAALGPAQAEADAASKRRGIDTFALPGNPVGLEIGQGADAADVLSFVGTAVHDGDLNVELRAFLAGGHEAITMNYTGETTQSRAAKAAPLVDFTPTRDDAGTSFELITGTPGNGVADEYSDYMDHLADNLSQRFGGDPVTWDDTPIVFAVHQHGEVTGFVLTNQGNQLVLGENKYADVQNVACFTADADLAAAYTIVGFNRKTSGPGAAPVFHTANDSRFGLIARCGSL